MSNLLKLVKDDYQRRKQEAAEQKVQQVIQGIIQNPAKFANASSLTDERTWLHFAAQQASPEAVAKLLECGADVHAVDLTERTALHHCAFTSSPLAARVIDLLVDFQGDPNAVDCMGYTPLHFAAQMENAVAMKALLKRGAIIDAVGPSGFTALHQLAQSPSGQACMKVLIDAGAKTHVYDEMQRTPVDVARDCKSFKNMRVLHEAEKSRSQVQHLYSAEAKMMGEQVGKRKLEMQDALPQLMLAMATGKSALDGRTSWGGKDSGAATVDGSAKDESARQFFEKAERADRDRRARRPTAVDGANEVWEGQSEAMTAKETEKRRAKGQLWGQGERDATPAGGGGF